MQHSSYTIGSTSRQTTTLNKSTGVTSTTTVHGSRTLGYELDDKPSQKVSGGRNRYAWRNPTGYSRSGTRWSDWVGSSISVSDNPGWTTTIAMNGFGNSSLRSLLSFSPEVAGSSALAQAEIKALQHVKNVKANYALIVAEGNKSINMIANAARRLSIAMLSLKRGKFRTAAEQLGVTSRGSYTKGLANSWLELQYGWKPLLSDIYQGYQDFHHGFEPHLSGKGVALIKPEVSFKSFNIATQTTTTISGKRVSGWKVRLDFTADNEALAFSRQLGLTNPLSIAWELIPFSFVADWFIPVGDLIDALDAPLGLSWKGGSRTFFQFLNLHGESSTDSSSVTTGGTSSYHAEYTSELEQFEMIRYVYPGPPVPVPYYRNPFSVAHAQNAAALLRQAFR